MLMFLSLRIEEDCQDDASCQLFKNKPIVIEVERLLFGIDTSSDRF